MTDTELLAKITQARKRLLLDYPWFGTLALMLKVELGDEPKYAAATDGSRIIFRPDYVESSSATDLVTGYGRNEVVHCFPGDTPIVGCDGLEADLQREGWGIACTTKPADSPRWWPLGNRPHVGDIVTIKPAPLRPWVSRLRQGIPFSALRLDRPMRPQLGMPGRSLTASPGDLPYAVHPGWRTRSQDRLAAVPDTGRQEPAVQTPADPWPRFDQMGLSLTSPATLQYMTAEWRKVNRSG